MRYHHRYDANTDTAARVPFTAEEEAAADAAEAAAAAEAQGRTVRTGDARTGLDRIAELPGVRVKLRAVANGTDTLTAAQMQRLVAALGLVALAERGDV